MVRTQASVKKEEKRSSEKCEKKEGKEPKKIEGKDEKNDNGSSGQTSESIKKSEEKKRISMLCIFLLSPFLMLSTTSFLQWKGRPEIAVQRNILILLLDVTVVEKEVQ